MDTKRAGQMKPLEAFIAKLKKLYSPKLVLLFGSRSRGDDLIESDYDILVVSSAFRNTNWIKRHEEAYACWDLDMRLDLLCYSPEEFESKSKQVGIVRKAVEEGKVLYRT